MPWHAMVELEKERSQILLTCQGCWALADLGAPNGSYGASMLKQFASPKFPKPVLDTLVFHSQMAKVRSCFHAYYNFNLVFALVGAYDLRPL